VFYFAGTVFRIGTPKEILMNLQKPTTALQAIFFVLAGLKYFGVEIPFADTLTGIAGVLGGAGGLLGAFTDK
jgi:hypothetical protein